MLGALIFLPANQLIPNNANTALLWSLPATGFDDLGSFNASQPARLTVPSGVTRAKATAVVIWGTDTSGAYNTNGGRQIVIKKSSAFYPGGGAVNQRANTFSTTDHQVQTAWTNVSPGDYYTAEVMQDCGLGLNAFQATGTWFQVEFA